MMKIWLLRTGLFLELFGASLLAVDVLDASMRDLLRHWARKIIKYEIYSAIFLSVSLLLLYRVLEGILRPFLVFNSDHVRALMLEFPHLDVWLLLLETNIFIIDFIIIETRVQAFEVFIIVMLPIIALAQILLIRAQSTANISPSVQQASGIGVIIAIMLAILPSILAIIVPAVVHGIIVVILVTIPIFPIWIGFRLEEAGTVNSGLRFAGFLFLSIGFLTQLVWTIF